MTLPSPPGRFGWAPMAYRTRLAGYRWPTVARIYGYTDNQTCANSVRQHARRHGLTWPIRVPKSTEVIVENLTERLAAIIYPSAGPEDEAWWLPHRDGWELRVGLRGRVFPQPVGVAREDAVGALVVILGESMTRRAA